MRRLRHFAFSLISLISLLLFLLFCAMWPLSYWRSLSLNLHMGSADMRHNFRNELDVQVLHGMTSVNLSRDTLPAFLDQVQQRRTSGIEPLEFDLNGQWSSSNWSLYPPEHQMLGIGGQFSSQKGPAKDEPFDGSGLFGGVNPSWCTSGLVQSPLWLPVLLTALLPLLWARSAVRAHRQRRGGFCRGCGYDLRATPSRCPECGLEPVVESKTATRRIRIRHILLAAALLISVSMAALWAVSYPRWFQVTIQAPLEEMDDDVDRSAQLTVHDGLVVASRDVHVQAIRESDLNDRRQQGTSPRDIVFEAHWLPRNEEMNLPLGDPPIEHTWRDFGYTRASGDSLQFMTGQPSQQLNWSVLAAQCPLWSIALAAGLFPLYALLRLVFRNRKSQVENRK